MNSYDLLSLTTTGQSGDNTAGTTRGLPPRQSERDLMLDRQSPVLVRAPELLQAQSPLPALVGGEPSTEAGHWRLCAQARRGKHRFSHWVHQSSRSLALDKRSASTTYYMRGEGGGEWLGGPLWSPAVLTLVLHCLRLLDRLIYSPHKVKCLLRQIVVSPRQ